MAIVYLQPDVLTLCVPLLADGDTLKWSVEELQLASFSAPEVPASLSGGAVLKITFGKMDV